LANQKQVFPKAAMFSNGSGRNDAMSNRYREPSIDVSYQVSFHLAKRFHKKRLKCEKLTDDGRQLMAIAHMAFRSGELKTKLETNNKTNSAID
jgi:hypothetical protein